MSNLVLVYLETVFVLVQDRVHGLRQTYHRVIYHFGHTRWYSKVTRLKWKPVSIHLEIVLNLTEDRCTVCAERTIGLEIVLDAPDGTPR
jgi:hypothetical protein